MYCENCRIDYGTKEDYNRHILNGNCMDYPESNEPGNSRIVYTNSGDPIRAEDDISEFLNQDDDDYVPN